MLEQEALVVRHSLQQIWVETQIRSSCSHCSSSSNCGTSVLAKLFSVKRNQLCLDNSLGAKTGEKVIVGMPDSLLIRAAMWAYILPLVSMLSATLIGSAAGVGDGFQSFLGLCGLVAGFFLVYRKTNSAASKKHFKPRLIRMLEPTEYAINFQKNTDIDKLSEKN